MALRKLIKSPGLIICSRTGFWHWGHCDPPSEPNADSTANAYQVRLIGPG